LVERMKYQLQFPDHTAFQGMLTHASSYFLNLVNIASKAAWLSGISSTQISEILSNYTPEPTRTEIWKTFAGSLIINDTYCSDPLSIDNALQLFNFASNQQNKSFVFSGMRTTQDSNTHEYERIGKTLSKASLKHLYLYGEKPFKPLIEVMEKESKETEITCFGNEKALFDHLKNHVNENDLLLFKGEKKIPLETLAEVFNESQMHNQCTINLAAIRNNIAMIRSNLPPGTSIMFMAKALAYGTDDVRMAKFLLGCGIDILGVSYLDEAIALKKAGAEQRIFSLNVTDDEAAKAIKWGIEIGVGASDLIKKMGVEAARQEKKVKVHLHVDTGMGRFGCRPEEALFLSQLISGTPYLELEGIMTHFACADDPAEDAFTLSQIESFDQAIRQLEENGIKPRFRHAANSSGALRFSLPQYNMVRIGLAAYGLYVSDSVKNQMDLRLALTLTSRIVGINICKKGDTVSYGRNYRVERDMEKIAVLPIGYYDGIHRHYSGKAHVLIHGQKAFMVGNICMDYMMVDITDIEDAAVGDSVLIFGEDAFAHYISPEEFAGRGNSIIHELITCLGPRIQRLFVYEEGAQLR
ncbi:MAG: alanine racemase, partial [Parachlamydia sp.]|nr:alanine racemase [Parachlamydia sp.]